MNNTNNIMNKSNNDRAMYEETVINGRRDYINIQNISKNYLLTNS